MDTIDEMLANSLNELHVEEDFECCPRKKRDEAEDEEAEDEYVPDDIKAYEKDLEHLNLALEEGLIPALLLVSPEDNCVEADVYHEEEEEVDDIGQRMRGRRGGRRAGPRLYRRPPRAMMRRRRLRRGIMAPRYFPRGYRPYYWRSFWLNQLLLLGALRFGPLGYYVLWPHPFMPNYYLWAPRHWMPGRGMPVPREAVAVPASEIEETKAPRRVAP